MRAPKQSLPRRQKDYMIPRQPEPTPIEKGSGNVFRDLGMPNPEAELAKARALLAKRNPKMAALFEAENKIALILSRLEYAIRTPLRAVEISHDSRGSYVVAIGPGRTKRKPDQR